MVTRIDIKKPVSKIDIPVTYTKILIHSILTSILRQLVSLIHHSLQKYDHKRGAGDHGYVLKSHRSFYTLQNISILYNELFKTLCTKTFTQLIGSDINGSFYLTFK